MNSTNNSTNKSPYEILGIPENSDEETIKKAFKKLALVYHPDKNQDPSAKEHFQEILNAYNKLTNKEPDNQVPPFNDIFQDLFRNFFNMQVNRVNHINIMLEIELEDLYKGITHNITINNVPVSITVPPKFTNGSLQIPFNDNTILNVQLIEKKNTLFRREGSDLWLTLNVTLKESLLGFKKEITFLDGSTVPVIKNDIVDYNTVSVVPGYGFTESGFLKIQFNIEFPKVLNDKQKELIEKIF
jgi:DnaJ-class molecular chaperone